MRLPLSWIKEFVDVDLPAQEIAKVLTMAGLEVDSIEFVKPSFEKVVVGKVIEVSKHPEADKLVIAKVTDGTETYQVVCGAPNCQVGMKTALALIGAVLQEADGQSFKVKKSKIRGVESFGMLCSGKELRISDDEDGIIHFSSDVVEGNDVGALYADTIFEISLTPNLGHCASVLGVARELSAVLRKPLRYDPISVVEDSTIPIDKSIQVKVSDPTGCPRYAGRIVRNVKIGPSPEWLQRRLEKCGLRPINNVVDVTNYVLMEIGQPLHAFDYEKIVGQLIEVRRAQEGESFTTLDGKERNLIAEDLVICDGERPVALAGIMGGQNSEVDDATSFVFIESAFFNPSVIRRTSKRLGLQTDSSKRFERGCDPNMVTEAVDRAAALMQMVAHGTVASGTLDVKQTNFPQKQVECRLRRIETLLGIHLGVSEIEDIFHRLGFSSHWNGRDTFSVRVPTFRHDINSEVDLIEEVARVYGYQNIPQNPPRFHPSNIPHAPIYVFEQEARGRLMGLGLQEVITCDLIGPTLIDIVQDNSLPAEMVVHVVNPTSIEQSILRTTLLPGMLQTIKHNYDHQLSDVSIFEVGRIHYKKDDAYKEQSVAGIVLMGSSRPHHWDRKPQDWDFFDLKGMVESFLKLLNVNDVTFKSNTLNSLHPGRQAAIFVKDLEIGSMGEVHPEVMKRLDVPKRVYFAEINLHDLYKVQQKGQKAKDIPIYPGSERDWTITLKESLPISTVFDAIASTKSALLERVTLVDLYRSEKIGHGVKNATFRFVYRDPAKTISQTVVDGEHARILDGVRVQQGIGNW